MSMSKKDYEMIAEVLTTVIDDDAILQLAYRFAKEDPNFRWDIFLEAADYSGDYKISSNGRISSPGKFEGEAPYVPAAWELHLEGYSVELDPDLIEVILPWAGEHIVIGLHHDEQGFVTEQQRLGN